jgi:hypothetical protein
MEDATGDGRDRDRRHDADEDQERRHQEAAADSEHSRNEADREPHAEQKEHVDRKVGDGEIDLHRLRQPSLAGSSGPA